MDEKFADDKSECYKVATHNNHNVFMLKEITNCKLNLTNSLFST